MYKIPGDFDATTMKNEIISQIAFGLNFITIYFDKGFIQFSGSFSFLNTNGMTFHKEVFPVINDYGLLKILEKRITKVLVNNNRDELTLIVEDGSELCLIGNEMYESFHLQISGTDVII